MFQHSLHPSCSQGRLLWYPTSTPALSRGCTALPHSFLQAVNCCKQADLWLSFSLTSVSTAASHCVQSRLAIGLASCLCSARRAQIMASQLSRRHSLPVLLLLLLLLLDQTCWNAAAAKDSAADWQQGHDARKATAAQHAQHHWNNVQHRLQSLQLDGHGLGNLLRHVMSHQYTLPMEQVQKGLVYTGSNFRLRKVVHDLVVSKRPIKVGAIGGSITNGAKASKIGETDWFALVGQYLKAAFPKANITTRNGALPATPSALMNMCLEQYVDEDVDLIFVEYVANDGSNRFDEVKAKVYERLLRKLLTKPNRPAVVLLQLMPKGMAYEASRSDKTHFYATLEDSYGAQAQYYDLPWLSFRNAMWRLSELHVHGYNWTDFMWDVDYMHPIDPGMAAIADLVAYLTQQTALSLLLRPLSGADRALLQEQLPAPMFNGNWEARNLMCTYGEHFKPLVDTAATSGWDFINEGRPDSPKWGFISRQPGSVLKIRVNSMREQGSDGAADGKAGSSRDEPMNVMLAYLKSYEGMGMASFECTSGCTCEARKDVDALHELRQSTIFLVRLLVSQAEECEISVTLSDKTRSDSHKFKVSGIMMNEYVGADVTEKLHEEQWLTQLQETAKEGSNRAVGGSSSSSSSSSSTDSGSSSAAALQAVPADGLTDLAAAAKESIQKGGAGGGTFVAAAATAEPAEGSASQPRTVVQQEAAQGTGSSGSSDRRLRHRRPRQLLQGVARSLRHVQQQLQQGLKLRDDGSQHH